MEGINNNRTREAFSTPPPPSKSIHPSPENKIFMQGFSTFCQQTSLHGWQYIASEKGLCRKIIWFLIILAFSVASISKTKISNESMVQAVVD